MKKKLIAKRDGLECPRGAQPLPVPLSRQSLAYPLQNQLQRKNQENRAPELVLPGKRHGK